MRARMLIPLIMFLAGIACIVAAIASGEAKVQLLVIFPLISGSSLLFILGVALIILSFVAGFVMFATSAAKEEVPNGSLEQPQGRTSQGRTRFGGVVLIGPIPIVFGSDRKMALAMLIIAVVVVAIFLAVFLLGL